MREKFPSGEAMLFVEEETTSSTERKPMTKQLMVGIDLHSNNLFCGVVDSDGKRVFERKLPCELGVVLRALAPFKERIAAVAVESTYNWYWLVDGLQDAGYEMRLANPAGMEQYSGLKHGDDRTDAYFLAELLRLNILPTGHICDRHLRSVRDLLRRRMLLVRQRTSLILSVKCLHARTLGQALGADEVKTMSAREAQEGFTHPADQLVGKVEVTMIAELGKGIRQVEKMVLAMTRPMPGYKVLLGLPGVGKILALTITLETAGVARFPTAGNYASYCRCVKSLRLSNGKKKGEGNGKCGNKYLSWAYVEAANFAKRYDEESRRFFDRKTARTNNIVATKALACKLAKAAWHMMSQGSPYDPRRMFPNAAHGAKTPGFNALKPIPQAGMPERKSLPVPVCGIRTEGGARVASQQSPILRFGKKQSNPKPKTGKI